jgi:hypothetical protein
MKTDTRLPQVVPADLRRELSVYARKIAATDKDGAVIPAPMAPRP